MSGSDHVRTAAPAAADGPPVAVSPIVLGLDHVYYWVTDMDRAVVFYRDVLALPLARRDGASWAVFDVGGRSLALHGAVDGHAVVPGGATAVLEVEDLDVAEAILAERGVRFAHQGDVAGFARFASFHDPDGNTLQLIEYPPAGERP
jgi:catechol 2,3-dioxygenase-like lactoylglutathione lyase family enzyme